MLLPPADTFRAAQIIATFVAMTSNFLLNNELTYRDRRLKGWAMLRGFVLFCLIGSVGVLANVDLAGWLYMRAPDLVGGGRGRRGDERVVELRHVHAVCLARAMIFEPPSVAARVCCANTSLRHLPPFRRADARKGGRKLIDADGRPAECRARA